MYKLLLISKYLRRKLAPLFAAVAVTICTAMVIIVASVMGGFLGLMQTTAKQLTPDVTIRSPSQNGFDEYELLIQRLEAEPEVAVATPAIETPATVTIGGNTRLIYIRGIEPAKYDEVVPYYETLMWTDEDFVAEQGASLPAELRNQVHQDFDLESAGQTLTTPPGFERFGMAGGAPAAVIGIAVNPYQRRDTEGQYGFNQSMTNLSQAVYYEMNPIKIAMPVFSPTGDLIDAQQVRIPVVNEFKSGFYEIDESVIIVPLDWLQQSLQMDEAEEFTDFDELTGLGGESVTRSARCTNIYVKAADGVTDQALVEKVRAVTKEFTDDRPDTLLTVLTWEDVHGTLLGAVKNEKGMVTFLFGIISLVAIIMVATTFYMIVLEKTRDIGVLRAIGAPASGVLGLFLFYGLAIGLIGAAAGVWLAWFTVTNLNNLQDALANKLATLITSVVIAFAVALTVSIGVAIARKRRDFSLGAGVTLFLAIFISLMAITFYAFPSIYLPGITNAQIMIDGKLDIDPNSNALDSKFGWRMWDPQLYFFEKIPDQVDWNEVFWIWLGAVLSSVLGAIIPAVIAARLNPVEALRYE